MSLSSRLNLAAVILFAVILTSVFYKTLHTTVQHIQQEALSNKELAVEMLDAQLKLLATYPYIEVRPEKLPELFRLEQFSDSKYLKIELFDNTGQLLASNHHIADQMRVDVPNLLRQVLLHQFRTVDPIEKEIVLARMSLGKIVISSNRDSELYDVWSIVLSALTPFFVMFLLVLLSLTAVITFIIKPITQFIKSVKNDDLASRTGQTATSRLHHLLGLSEHLKDISHELKSSTRQVKHLNQKVLHLQEEERRRLSAELHDELGQHLTAIRFESAAIQTARTLEEAQQSAEAIDNVGREMRDIVRSMLVRLRPPSIESMGLKHALSEIISDWQLRHPDNIIHFNCETDFSFLSEDEQLNLYRIVQEALTNISRHAGEAKLSVMLSLYIDRGYLMLRISDNGLGCDLNSQVKGHGLKGMTERVESLSGVINIDSAPGKGMQVSVDIPVVVEKVV